MASAKVKFRKSSVIGKAGTVYYQLCHNNLSKQISTKIHLQPDEWQLVEERIERKLPLARHLAMYQTKISNDLQTLRQIIRSLEARPHGYTLGEVADLFRATSSEESVLEYMRRQIEHLRQRKRYGTASNYRCALNSLSQFLHGEDLPFSLLNEGLVLQYSEWLHDRRIKKNSLSFYMRIWRAVYNRATKERIIEQTFPFQNVYTGIDRTRKRAVNEETILRLYELELEKHPSLALARDLFIFSYCTRGMAFVDIAFLKKTDLTRTHIRYCRRKTDQSLQIRIEPCIEQIIRRYEVATRHSVYVFPILSSQDEEQAYKQYERALGYHNHKLKLLGEMIGLDLPLTSYTSRHTWATTARNHNIPLSVISAGMGHTSEKTTQIYLASLENSVIDDANYGLLMPINRVAMR